MVKQIIAKKEEKQNFSTMSNWAEVLDEAISAAPTGMLICELIQRKQREIDYLSEILDQLDRGALYER